MNSSTDVMLKIKKINKIIEKSNKKIQSNMKFINQLAFMPICFHTLNKRFVKLFLK